MILGSCDFRSLDDVDGTIRKLHTVSTWGLHMLTGPAA
jgi:hypothetical protein